MIKFRFWDKLTKEYRMLDLGDIAEYDYLGGEEMWVAVYDATNEQERFILEQFTGLQDKNGVDIYQGDIVKYEDYFTYSLGGIVFFENIAEVSHDIFEGIILINYTDDGGDLANDFREETFNQGYKEFWQSVEVIGNINENKELLE